MKTHTQCRMQKGAFQTIAWIPTEFAVIGHYLKLYGDNGWLVLEAGHTLPSDYVRGHERDYKVSFPSLEN